MKQQKGQHAKAKYAKASGVQAAAHTMELKPIEVEQIA